MKHELTFGQGGKYAYLILPDPAAGRRNRFTLHRVGLIGMKSTKVIGRELTLGHCRKIIKQEQT